MKARASHCPLSLTRKLGVPIVLFAAVMGIPLTGNAQMIGTFSKDTAFPGTNTTVTGSGSSATITAGTTAAGNTAIVAPFTALTLSVGQTITFSGNATFSNAGNLGNIQFRFGIFNTSTPATSGSYLGYLGEVPANATGQINGVTANGTAFASNSGGTALTLTGNNPGTANGTQSPFTFTISVTYNGTSTTVKDTFVSSNGTSFNYSATATDTTTAARTNATYNEIGLFYPGLVAGDTLSFTNLAISVPEPGTWVMLLAGCALAGGLWLRRNQDNRHLC